MSRYPEEPAWPSPEAPAGGAEGSFLLTRHFDAAEASPLIRVSASTRPEAPAGPSAPFPGPWTGSP